MAKTLKEVREEKGVKLEAVAEAIGVTRQTYAKYEANQGEMSIKQARDACEFLGVSPDSIFFAKRG